MDRISKENYYLDIAEALRDATGLENFHANACVGSPLDLSVFDKYKEVGFETIASGDSFNDLGMIRASKAGFLFKSTPQIKKDHPDIPAFEEYNELLEAIKAAL